jgi:pimeloyl-ACP methyl ester carboxylesterase
LRDQNLASGWRDRGSYFSWAPREPGTAPVEIFHVQSGDEKSQVVLLVHGFPTCSIDWFAVTDLLRDRFRVCTLDFPGYGFSDKPQGWGYSLDRDAELLDYYVRDILGAESVLVMAHDRGSSVALNYVLAQQTRIGDGPATHVEHLVLTDGNLYLPLSNLTEFQQRVLDPFTAPAVLDALTPSLLAAGLGQTTFSPPRAPDHPDVQALIETFAYADGVKVLHETIQYLIERAKHETEWLEALARSDIATTILWGVNDTVSPPRVANHIWDEYLMLKPGINRFYLLPDANHYLQVDRPEGVVAALLHTLDPSSSSSPGPISAERGAPLLIDCSRPRLPSATEVLRSAE